MATLDRNFDHPHLDPVGSVARVRGTLLDTGRWVDGMDITELLGLARTVHYVNGTPFYTVHEVYPAGMIDPDVAESMLRRALRRYELRNDINDFLP